MRTTVDIPDGLLRRVKAEAALRGWKLKDYVTQALRASLERPPGPGAVTEPEPTLGGDEIVLGENCVFPLIRGEGGPALANLTPKTLSELLTEEEIESALDSR